VWKNYLIINTIEELCNELDTNPSGKKIIAGGTDLLLEMERGLRPEIHTLLDITRIQGLDQIWEDDEGFIHIGPLVTHNDIVGSVLIRLKAYPLLQACWQIGSPQIRNAGTVAGNLITGSPANDTITPLMALGASLILKSKKGERQIPLREFYKGVRKTILQPNEVLVDIVFRSMSEEEKGLYIKSALRRAQAISVVNACVIIRSNHKVIDKCTITMGAVAPTIIHAENVENYITGRVMEKDMIEKASDLVEKDIKPISDIRGSDYYRAYMMKVILKKALESILHGEILNLVPDIAISLVHDPVKPKANNQWDGKKIKTRINNQEFSIEKGLNKNLLLLIRDQVGLTGTKEGCSEGECGACTVHLNGKAVMSCLVPAPRAHGSKITTIEGLSEGERLNPLQEAFVEYGAVQCGFCTPGFLMSADMLLKEKKDPDQDEIKQALTGNLCRCTGYYKIIQAIEAASREG
jgi:xanthine dehydrogenase iron-sulfur cluster and FAD-binding subunit A